MISYNEFIQNIINTRGQWNVDANSYWEGHHIIPKCMGGEGKSRDKHPNIIWLYPREHLIAHFLLYFENKDNIKISNALLCMVCGNNKSRNFFDNINNINEQELFDFADVYAKARIEAKMIFSIKNKQINNSRSKEEKLRIASCGGQGMKHKLESDEDFKNQFIEKQIARHTRMSKKEKEYIYSKVSCSLKKFYKSSEWQERKEGITRKNSETNKIVSFEFREKFNSIFNHSPEWYRKFGKLKDVRKLFEEIKFLDFNEQIKKAEDFTNYCLTLPIIKYEKDLDKKSKQSKEYHNKQRNMKSKYIYELDNLYFYNSFDLRNYINNTYCDKYKISSIVINELDDLGWHYNYRCRNEIKKICDELVLKIKVLKKENYNER